MQKQYLRGLVTEVAPNKKSVRVIASTGVVDRQGEAIDPAGWDLTNFKKNPVLLWSHNAFELPIGKVTNIEIDVQGRLVADTEFASDISDQAAKVELMVRAGLINAVSVGFMPTEMDNTGKVLKQELLELSYVNVPANQEALVQSRAYKSFEAEVKTWEKTDEKKDQAPTAETLQKTITQLEKALQEKEGRVISENNRNQIRAMVDACKTAAEVGQKMLEDSAPPERRADNAGDKDTPSKRLRTLRMLDRVLESLIREEKAA